jgi:hypothetical protein
MEGEISARSARELLQMLAGASNLHGNAREDIELTVYQRWRDGTDLDPLIELLKSETKRDQLAAAFYLIEVVPRHETIAQLATEFADHRLSYCRKAFVGYITNAGLYDEAIAAGLAKCLKDTNPFVRSETINWAVYTPDSRFADFSLRIKGISDPEGTAFRGITIARRLRENERVRTIRESISEEDSFIFDYLQIVERRLMRYMARRKSKDPVVATTTVVYDEFEIGVVGEAYDNLGMLKGRRPPKEVPPHVTDDQLQDMIDRATDSINHRKLDQQALDMARRE